VSREDVALKCGEGVHDNPNLKKVLHEGVVPQGDEVPPGTKHYKSNEKYIRAEGDPVLPQTK